MTVLKSSIHKNIEELEKLAKTIFHKLNKLEAKDNSINKKERNNDEVPKIDDEWITALGSFRIIHIQQDPAATIWKCQLRKI